jgi:hypothetical protein
MYYLAVVLLKCFWTYNLWQYRLGQSSFHIFPDTYFPPSLPPPVSMLAPRIQTSDFCWLNIELGERGALFLSNYMKLQQLSHSFWQRLSWWWSMMFGIKRFSSKFIAPNNIYSSIKAYVGKVLVLWDTIHSGGRGYF